MAHEWWSDGAILCPVLIWEHVIACDGRDGAQAGQDSTELCLKVAKEPED